MCRPMRVAALTVIALLVLGSVGAASAMPLSPGTVRCVNPGGTGGCFSTIQAAINASASGDRIDVAAGTYQEHITLKDGVSIHGQGWASTIIDGHSTSAVSTVTVPWSISASTVLSGVQVTGGGTGIGAAIACALGQAGAAVSLAGRRLEPLQQVARGLSKATAIAADITKEADTAAMVKSARDAHGPIDILIANAGAAESAPAHRIDLAHWQRMLDVNLTGAFLTARAALPDIARKEGPEACRRIVFTASNAGILGNFGQTNYGAAKMGLVGLSNVLSLEGAKYNIKCNAIAPTARTRMTEELLGPLAPLLDPETVTPLVVYLGSEACELTRTGQRR